MIDTDTQCLYSENLLRDVSIKQLVAWSNNTPNIQNTIKATFELLKLIPPLISIGVMKTFAVNDSDTGLTNVITS